MGSYRQNVTNPIFPPLTLWLCENTFMRLGNKVHIIITKLNDDFISSARVDNLLSCYVGLLSICSVSDDKPMLFIASDEDMSMAC